MDSERFNIYHSPEEEALRALAEEIVKDEATLRELEEADHEEIQEIEKDVVREVEELKAALRKERDELIYEAKKEVLRAKWLNLLDLLKGIEQQLAELEVLE